MSIPSASGKKPQIPAKLPREQNMGGGFEVQETKLVSAHGNNEINCTKDCGDGDTIS
ncbi:hypothetical protein [Neobacillus bataviensis]|uniref:hypothetical protein n=1 Tax=Neobacillus bataviensis TaxID=220685 RepID=UPI001CBCB2BD|nr:hypothetical protein [Neobacillus bataviensis]